MVLPLKDGSVLRGPGAEVDYRERFPLAHSHAKDPPHPKPVQCSPRFSHKLFSPVFIRILSYQEESLPSDLLPFRFPVGKVRGVCERLVKWSAKCFQEKEKRFGNRRKDVQRGRSLTEASDSRGGLPEHIIEVAS